MTSTDNSLTRGEWIGLAVLLGGVLFTALLFYYGIADHALPKWLLVLATII